MKWNSSSNVLQRLHFLGDLFGL